MKNRFLLILFLILGLLPAVAVTPLADEQAADAMALGLERVPDARNKFVRDRYYFVTEYGDTALMVELNNITVFPPMRFKNKKQEQFYWRTVRDVKRTLPYAKLIAETLLETYDYIETFPTKKEREQYLSQMEKEIFKQYKPVLRRFTRSQGQMLVKLIDRETNQSSYNIIKAFLGSFRAGFWQTFGHFFGVNLKARYQPEKNEKDAIIERVCTLVEQGML